MGALMYDVTGLEEGAYRPARTCYAVTLIRRQDAMRLTPALMFVVALSAAGSAWAQTIEENATRCESNDPDASIAGCTAVIQSGQLSAADLHGAYVARSFAYHKKGLNDEAIADATEAIALNPGDFQAYVIRGLAYDWKGLHDWAHDDATKNNDDSDHALADFTKAIALAPDNADVYRLRAGAEDEKGLKDQAIGHL